MVSEVEMNAPHSKPKGKENGQGNKDYMEYFK